MATQLSHNNTASDSTGTWRRKCFHITSPSRFLKRLGVRRQHLNGQTVDDREDDEVLQLGVLKLQRGFLADADQTFDSPFSFSTAWQSTESAFACSCLAAFCSLLSSPWTPLPFRDDLDCNGGRMQSFNDYLQSHCKIGTNKTIIKQYFLILNNTTKYYTTDSRSLIKENILLFFRIEIHHFETRKRKCDNHQ